MATTIRLKRVGAKKEASYRIVVMDAREGTAGASIERIGMYNPRTRPSLVRLDAARAIYWLREGAQPSDTVRSLFQKTGVWKQFVDGVDPGAVEEGVIELGPPPGERGTSQRPMPSEAEPEPAEEPAEKAAEKPSAKTAKPKADEAAEPEAEAEAEEAPEDDATEEPTAEAEEAPAAEAEEAPEAEAEEAPEAEAEEAPEDDAPAEATAEAEEAAESEDEAEAEEESEDDEES